MPQDYGRNISAQKGKKIDYTFEPQDPAKYFPKSVSKIAKKTGFLGLRKRAEKQAYGEYQDFASTFSKPWKVKAPEGLLTPEETKLQLKMKGLSLGLTPEGGGMFASPIYGSSPVSGVEEGPQRKKPFAAWFGGQGALGGQALEGIKQRFNK